MDAVSHSHNEKDICAIAHLLEHTAFGAGRCMEELEITPLTFSAGMNLCR